MSPGQQKVCFLTFYSKCCSINNCETGVSKMWMNTDERIAPGPQVIGFPFPGDLMAFKIDLILLFLLDWKWPKKLFRLLILRFYAPCLNETAKSRRQLQCAPKYCSIVYVLLNLWISRWKYCQQNRRFLRPG